ncbi:MAG TPA: site-2 protease family protein [Saprospiraceae bacterium]|nr:site-2 protease family protein [Saprospiraceae bacterium]
MAESVRTISRFDFYDRQLLAPSAKEWRLHGLLFAVTIITTTLAGVMLTAPELPIDEPPLNAPIDYILYLPVAYARSVVELIRYVEFHPILIISGITFSVSLLAILFSHEMGHYLTCRYYGVNATLPFFIPAPPFFLAGTFGAFIKIRTAIPTRRALFDIGLAGPLAGFIVAIPVSLFGLLTLQAPVHTGGVGITFNDPLLFRLLARAMGIHLYPDSPINPYYMAAWLGLLVTSLNLMPVGQLDGGHGTFSVFGQRAHRVIGRVAFVAVAVLALLGFWWHGSPSGFLYAVLLGIMLRIRHPAPAVMEPLGTKRIVIAILTLIVFVLCFTPFPITLR